MSPRRRYFLQAALLALALGCPGPIIDDYPKDHGAPQPANHSSNYGPYSQAFSLEGATGICRGTVDSRSYLLAGTKSGLTIVREDGSYFSQLVPGPVADPPASGLQRDVEFYKGFAYLCSNALGSREGVMVVDLRNLSTGKATWLRSLTPQDGNPRAGNLSVDPDSGCLYLQRASGVEVWNLEPDPSQPVFTATFATGVPVSDLVVQGGYAYLAEGANRSFSLWSVADPAHPSLTARWTVPGFARSIWPNETGDLIGTTDESTTQPVRFWTRSPSAGVLAVGGWSFGDGTAPYSIKLASHWAYLGHGQAGLVVLDVADPTRPATHARFDGPMPGGEPALRDTWDVLPPLSSGPVTISDRQKGLVQVPVY